MKSPPYFAGIPFVSRDSLLGICFGSFVVEDAELANPSGLTCVGSELVVFLSPVLRDHDLESIFDEL